MLWVSMWPEVTSGSCSGGAFFGASAGSSSAPIMRRNGAVLTRTRRPMRTVGHWPTFAA